MVYVVIRTSPMRFDRMDFAAMPIYLLGTDICDHVCHEISHPIIVSERLPCCQVRSGTIATLHDFELRKRDDEASTTVEEMLMSSHDRPGEVPR